MRGLYSAEELLGGFDPMDPGSYASTLDARTFLDAWNGGIRIPNTDDEAMRRAAHDSEIGRALHRALEGRKVVAVMGGHKLTRDSRDYRDVARLSRDLARLGYLMVSGGGPGAMEATHLGARLASADAMDLDDALRRLEAAPAFPSFKPKELVVNGTFAPSILSQLHAWQKPAFEVAAMTADSPGVSISIPTWLYGHEPPTPLATGIAKYFENSIREDGLLAVALHGVVFAKGSAGTMQEIFQDAAQNFYSSAGFFSPMVFLDLDEYWSVQRPVKVLLEGLFDDAQESFLCFARSIEEARDAIAGFEPPQ